MTNDNLPEKNNNSNEEHSKILDSIKPNKIIFPILIGLGVVSYMLYDEFDPKVFENISFSWSMAGWLVVAAGMMLARDIGYMIRIRILSDNELSWAQCFRLIMLWEFTSALTPSAIGGSGVAIYLVHKEGIKLGRSTAIVMSSIFLDELYFILSVPLLILIVGAQALFTIGESVGTEAVSFANEFFYFAVVGYIAIFVFTSFLGYGLYVNPKSVKKLLVGIFWLPLLRRWRKAAVQTGNDIITSSDELRGKPFSFWVKSFLATALSWTGRYWIVNFLLLAFLAVNDHFLIFARQLIMWIMMIVSPTPGGSGFSEYVFKEFLGEFIQPAGLAVAMALLWRFITYYPYLFMGAIILPRWIRKKFVAKKK